MPFSIQVAKENFKFAAAHFIAYPGFREALHGHNYQVSIQVVGELASSGYVLDFGLIKELTREIVGRLDERTLIPTRSDCLKIEETDRHIHITCADSEFVLPASDVCLLPLAHSSAEELAAYIWAQLHAALEERQGLGSIHSLAVSVAEAPGQAAIYDAPVVTK